MGLVKNIYTMVKVKAHELRSDNKDALLKRLDDLRSELSQLRVGKKGPPATKLSKLKTVRKSIARVMTVLRQKEKKAVATHYTKRPYDLREKKTRAIRRALSAAQKNMVVNRVAKRQQNFPQRVYAVKA